MRSHQAVLDRSPWHPRQHLNVGFKISMNHRMERRTYKLTRDFMVPDRAR